MTRPEPVFEEPWHAQVFAITVHLNETGLFTWQQWAERFGATLKRHGHHTRLNGGSDYFAAWLETLETLLGDTSVADPAQLETLRHAWEAAYLNTPHGAPVTLDARAD
ncbi:nitrile hydratase accessory protein [Sulfitobacter brevis]|uniref:Nitrile hydratase accessory protein n=1 Tax=Sulfitobacter brevis TaxID=74348 RepID=A0A1I2APZ4_9RHOB|nr:nitrile hydratase accessory protein [Sulfitobacter brevis]SFE45787.1 nitrile hydratase accessory protein [Sulfitobacter brevis]